MELIKHCVEKYGQKRSWVKRTVRFNADKEAIQKCKDGLKQSLDLFSVRKLCFWIARTQTNLLLVAV